MRGLLMMAVLLAAACLGRAAEDGADELIRVPLLDGMYTVEAPGDWHLEVSGDDFTATFQEAPGADGTLVIAPPNPVVDDIAEYNKMSVESLLHVFGNGEITDENDRKAGRYPASTHMFEFKVEDSPFVGWARTVDIDGYAVQTMAVASPAKYVAFMEKAGAIADSYVIDLDEADGFMAELRRLGRRSYDEIERHLADKREKEEKEKEEREKENAEKKEDPEKKDDGEKTDDAGNDAAKKEEDGDEGKEAGEGEKRNEETEEEKGEEKEEAEDE